MKKVIFSLVAVIGLGIVTNKVNAQQSVKIGYFDIDQMVSMLPEMKDVQAKVEAYQKDSLGPARDNIEFQYNRADSTYKQDSISKKPQAVLNYSNQERQKFAWQLINWQKIAENASQQKYAQLSQPYYVKVADALKKTVAEKKITVVLKPAALEVGTDENVVVNLFIPVAKALGVSLDQNQEGAAAGGESPSAQPAKPVTKPAAGKK